METTATGSAEVEKTWGIGSHSPGVVVSGRAQSGRKWVAMRRSAVRWIDRTFRAWKSRLGAARRLLASPGGLAIPRRGLTGSQYSMESEREETSSRVSTTCASVRSASWYRYSSVPPE
jgi:hypothetical protein